MIDFFNWWIDEYINSIDWKVSLLNFALITTVLFFSWLYARVDN